MGTRAHRVAGWAVACAGLAAVAVTADSCIRHSDDLPARIWVAGPLPASGVDLAARPDVRLAPGGGRRESIDAVWFVVDRADGTPPEVQIHALRTLNIVEFAMLLARRSVSRTAAAVYRPSDEIVTSGGTEWRAMDREPRRR